MAINLALIAVAIISGAFLFLVLLGVMFFALAFFVIRQKLTGKPLFGFTYQRYSDAEPPAQGTIIDVEYREVKERLE